jgi:precorrin-2 dehydrogenase/sirohydrochlorin ferrochelatase
MIPLFHDFSGKRVVIFGGGSVAARKAALFATEGEVIVHSLSFDDRFAEIDCRCNRTAVDGDLAAAAAAEAFLVIPATDDSDLNAEIADRARAAGTLVNRVDEAGETVTPSVVSGEHVTVGISTGGRSPAVSKHLRRQIEREIEAVDPMVELQADLREAADDLSEAARREFLWDVLEDERIRDALDAGADERARELALEHRP